MGGEGWGARQGGGGGGGVSDIKELFIDASDSNVQC